LERPLNLETIKAEAALGEMKLLKQTRLSVTSLTAAEFARLMELSGTQIGRY
jgi:predicted RNA-binding protein with PUA-like domain